MQDLSLHAHKASLAMEPIALLDYYVKIMTFTKGAVWGKVDFYEAIPPFQWIDFAAATPWGPLAAATPIAANTTNPKANITKLELEDFEFGQWRFFPLDNFMVQIFNPAGVSKWQLKNVQVGIDQQIIYQDPTLVSTEIFNYEDRYIAMAATNFSARPISTARIIGWGYRFHFKPLDEKSAEYGKLINNQLPYTPIQCSGYNGRESAV